MNKDDNAYKSIGEVAKILNLVNKKKTNKHEKSVNIVQNNHLYAFIEKELISNAIIVYMGILA